MIKTQLGYPARALRALYVSGDMDVAGIEFRIDQLGAEITRAWSNEQALESIRRSEPDLVVLDDRQATGGTLSLLQSLHAQEIPGATVPIVVLATPHAADPEYQAAHQSVGAWEIWTQEVDSDAFVLRLRNFLSARRQVIELRDAAFLDSATRLYTRTGLEARAVELAAQCARQGTLLSCVAFTVSVGDAGKNEKLDKHALAVLGHELLRIGRSSDTIGRADEQEFVVLAPGASGGDARQLANRITRSAVSVLTSYGITCDAPWVGRVLQPGRDATRLGSELLADTLLALQEVTAEHEIPTPY